MYKNFIKLFSLKKFPQIAMNAFDAFLKNKAVKNCTYRIESGFYNSQENLNHHYNYIIKIRSTAHSDVETFKIAIEEEYEKLVGIINPYLDENVPTFSTQYQTLLQISKPVSVDKLQINHLVFLPFKENCSNLAINESFSRLKNLLDKLYGISSFQYGKCEHVALEKNYIFEMAFTDCAARDHYLTHDEHLKVAEFIIPLLKNGKQSIIAFDYHKHAKFLEIKRNQFFKPDIEIHTTNVACQLDEGITHKK